MAKLLALLTNKKYWKLHSWIIAQLLRAKGIKVGRNFYTEGTPLLKVHGRSSNIIIGDNVMFLGDFDLRNRENGRIIFRDDVKIENNCRFVSAREGTIEVGSNSVVGAFSILNGGDDIRIGQWCAISSRVSINANEHDHTRGERIREQGFSHAPVIIEDDCLIGVNVSINKGVKIRKGSIIGANAVVTKDTEEYSINAGVPAKKIGERE